MKWHTVKINSNQKKYKTLRSKLRLISVLLCLVLLVSTFSTLQIYAATDTLTSAFVDSLITVDGEKGEDEIWSSIGEASTVTLNAWKSGIDDVASTEVIADNAPKLKIANSANYLYLYLDAEHFTNSDNNSGKRIFIQIAFPTGETLCSDVIYTDKEMLRAWDGGYSFINRCVL